jgi:hypothetical protein
MHTRECILTEGRSMMCETRAKTCDVRERRAEEAEASKCICETEHKNHIAKRRHTIEMENMFDFIHHMATMITFSKCVYTLPHHKATPTSLTKLQQALQILEKTTQNPPLCSLG